MASDFIWLEVMTYTYIYFLWIKISTTVNIPFSTTDFHISWLTLTILACFLRGWRIVHYWLETFEEQHTQVPRELSGFSLKDQSAKANWETPSIGNGLSRLGFPTWIFLLSRSHPYVYAVILSKPVTVLSAFGCDACALYTLICLVVIMSVFGFVYFSTILLAFCSLCLSLTQ